MVAPLLLIIASLVSFVLAQDLTINTPVPPPVSCEPQQLQWNGGSGAPYFITLVDSDDRSNILVNFGTLTNNSLTWFVDLPVGQNCLLTIKDSSGAGQTSGIFTIAGGGPTNCLGGGSASSGPSNSATPSKSAQSGKSSAPASTPATSKPASTPSAPSTPSTPSKPATTPSTAPSQSVTQPASSGGSSVSAAPSTAPSGGSTPTNVPAVAAAAAAAVGALFAALL